MRCYVLSDTVYSQWRVRFTLLAPCWDMATRCIGHKWISYSIMYCTTLKKVALIRCYLYEEKSSTICTDLHIRELCKEPSTWCDQPTITTFIVCDWCHYLVMSFPLLQNADSVWPYERTYKALAEIPSTSQVWWTTSNRIGPLRTAMVINEVYVYFHLCYVLSL